MPQIPEFAGRLLNEWDRAELEELAARQRRDPPKVRELINWMAAHDVEAMRNLSDDEVIAAAKELKMTVYASALDPLRGRQGPKVEPKDKK